MDGSVPIYFFCVDRVKTINTYQWNVIARNVSGGSLSSTFHDLLSKLLGSFFKKSKALLEIKAMLTIHNSNFKTNILTYDHSLRLNVREISLFHRRHWVHLGQNLPISTRTPNGRFRLQCAKVLFSHYLLYLFHSQFRAASWLPKYYCQLSKYTSFYSK